MLVYGTPLTFLMFLKLFETNVKMTVDGRVLQISYMYQPATASEISCLPLTVSEIRYESSDKQLAIGNEFCSLCCFSKILPYFLK